MYCTGKYLQNDCYENQEIGVFNSNSPKFKNWESKIKSFFISSKFVLFAIICSSIIDLEHTTVLGSIL